jgi:hypothetical protein
MYDGDGGVTFRVELGSFDLLRANMAAAGSSFALAGLRVDAGAGF